MTLALRHLEAGDAELLLRWRNDPDTRAASFTQEPIPLDEHREWLARRLADPHCAIYVAESDGGPVAQVRVERRTAGSGEIHVVVAPEARGRGVARRAIAMAAEAGARELELESIEARVKPGNEASLRAFRAAGFGEEEERDGLVALTWRGARSASPPQTSA